MAKVEPVKQVKAVEVRKDDFLKKNEFSPIVKKIYTMINDIDIASIAPHSIDVAWIAPCSIDVASIAPHSIDVAWIARAQES